jgi:hypothetical protein
MRVEQCCVKTVTKDNIIYTRVVSYIDMSEGTYQADDLGPRILAVHTVPDV